MNQLKKLKSETFVSHVYNFADRLMKFSESENSNFLYVAPSLIASDENVDYFLYNLLC